MDCGLIGMSSIPGSKSYFASRSADPETTCWHSIIGSCDVCVKLGCGVGVWVKYFLSELESHNLYPRLGSVISILTVVALRVCEKCSDFDYIKIEHKCSQM